jgi:hypothetical protein
VAERTALVNHIRGLLGEYGLVIAQGVSKVRMGPPSVRIDVASYREIVCEYGASSPSVRIDVASYREIVCEYGAS